MRDKILKYSAIFGISLVICFIQAFISVLISDSFANTLLLVMLSQYIYKDLKEN